MSDSEGRKPPEGEAPVGDAGAEKAPDSEAPKTGEAPVDEARAKAEAAKAKAEAAAKAKAAREAAEAAKPAWLKDPVTPEWAEPSGDALVEALAAEHGDSLVSCRTFAGDLVLTVETEGLVALARDLKERHGYRQLVDICGVHYPEREEAPLEVVYIVYNHDERRRVRFKVQVGEGVEVPTVTGVWRGADWTERETWDMYGVRFEGHPDMTRILLWEGFNGHPLRKEFPLEGVDTGAAIYPEYYAEEAGPVAGTGTGWKVPVEAEELGEAEEPVAPEGGSPSE